MVKITLIDDEHGINQTIEGQAMIGSIIENGSKYSSFLVGHSSKRQAIHAMGTTVGCLIKEISAKEEERAVLAGLCVAFINKYAEIPVPGTDDIIKKTFGDENVMQIEKKFNGVKKTPDDDAEKDTGKDKDKKIMF